MNRTVYEWVDYEGDLHHTSEPPNKCETPLAVRAIEIQVNNESITDTQRLDWVINHPDSEFDVDESMLTLSSYIVAHLTSGDAYSNGVSGRFIASGETHRDCIDCFLRGDIRRID